jgi:hypothetical protein
VLIRDGRNVKMGSRCRIISGSWRSFYDGLTLTSARRVDVDHILPLANAWRSGARRWTRARRRAFRERPRELAADRGERIVEPVEERPGAGGVEAAEASGVVPLLTLVGAGQTVLAAHGRSGRADGAAADGGDVLKG